MFDIGWSELLVIAVVAIVVVGPKDLPPLMRTFGRYARKARAMAADFQRQFDEALSESELKDLQDTYNRAIMEPGARLNQPVMLPKPQGEPAAVELEAVRTEASTPAKRSVARKPRKAAPKKSAAKRAQAPAAQTARPKASKPKSAARPNTKTAKASGKTGVRSAAKPSRGKPKAPGEGAS